MIKEKINSLWARLLVSLSTQCLIVCFCFLTSIGFLSLLPILWNNSGLMAVAATIGCALTFMIIFRTSGSARLLSVIVFGVLAGTAVFGFHVRSRFSEQTVVHLVGTSATVRGVVQNIPERYGNQRRYAIMLESWYRDRRWDPVRGNVLVNTDRFPEYAYGDRVVFSCSFQTTKKEQGRLLARGVVAQCETRESLNRESTGNGDPLFAVILRIRQRFLDMIEQRFSEPYAGLLAGLLVGERGMLDDSVISSFRRTGTMHMVAVSGFNVSLITFALFGILTRFVRRQKALWITLALLLIFVGIVGASASVVRAAIMGALALIGIGLGRSASASRLLLFAAMVMVAINPWLLWYDIGFQLSFVATFGLVIFAPLFARWLRGLPEVFDLRKIASETVAAMLATLPISAGIFGTVSFISPLANLAILLLVPFAMGFGMLAILFGSLPGIGEWFVGAAYLFLAAIIGFAEVFARIPRAFLNFEEANIRLFTALIMVVGTLILLIVRFRMIDQDEIKSV